MAIAVSLAWMVLNRDLFVAGERAARKDALALGGHECVFWAWLEICTYTFPYYVLSGSFAAFISFANRYLGWYLPLVALPVMFGIYRSYQRYFRTPAKSEVESVVAVTKPNAAGAM